MTPHVESTSSPGTMRRIWQACSKDITPRDRRNARRANWRLFAWMLSFVAVSMAISRELLSPDPVAWLAIAATTGLGVWAVLGYVRFLRDADELLRKIQFEALAWGFGAAFMANFTLSMIERVTRSPFEVGDLFLIMVMAYAVGVAIGVRRYA